MIHPMIFQSLFAFEQMISLWTVLYLALQTHTTLLPMSVPVLILENSLTPAWIIAFEVGVIELLHDKSIDIFVESDLSSTVRTRVLSLHPSFDAIVATQLIAFFAFFGIFDYLKTDVAGKVLVKWACDALFIR